MTDRPISAESALIHAGIGRGAGEPSSPPLVLASTYVSQGVPRPGEPSYGRDDNPTWDELEHALGGLEDARAVAFASGQAAAMALMLALTDDRPRLLLAGDGYYNTRVLAERLRPHGAQSRALDLLDLTEVERELATGNSVLWAESPTNPLLRVADLARLAELADAVGAPLVVDNTVATAVLQRPLDLGARASLLSLTKASSGHADVVLGAVVTRDEALVERLLEWRHLGGAIPGPFEAWLALRGLRTLPLRIERQSASALEIARHLVGHPRVRFAHYPGLDPDSAALVRVQMPRGSGPLLSFELDGSAAQADVVVAAARLIRPSTSFGGLELSWERRARWPAETAPEALIRLSVGLETLDDLVADIDASLAAI